MYVLRCSWCTLLLLALFASPHNANSISPSLARSRAAASLGKSLASLFLVKEGSVPGAKQSMSTFQVTSKRMHTAHQRTTPQGIVFSTVHRLLLHILPPPRLHDIPHKAYSGTPHHACLVLS